MRNLTRFVAGGVFSLLLIAGCTKDFNETAPGHEKQEQLPQAVWNEGTQSWMRPQKDPYALDNFRRAYDNIASGESLLATASKEFAASVQSVQQEFAAATRSGQELQATHRALRIWPQTEEEQRALELDGEIHVCYVPFDYVPVPNQEAEGMEPAAAGTVLEDERRYSVTYDDMMTTEGPAVPVTYILPVLYVAWPVEKPMPAGMDHEVLYEVYLPEQDGSGVLSDEAEQVLEQEAIAMATIPIEIGDTPFFPPSLWFGKPSGRVQHLDNFLDQTVPVTNLKIEFRNGSNITTCYTDGEGRFAIDKLVSGSATFSFVFEHPNWKITQEGQTSPIVDTWGTFKLMWERHKLEFCPGSSLPHYEIHRAANYFFHGSHAVPVSHYANPGVKIEALNYVMDGAAGQFAYSTPRRYIKISNIYRDEHSYLLGTVFHELGHFTQYGMRQNFPYSNTEQQLLAESWASYVGWELCESYYESLGRYRTPQTEPSADPETPGYAITSNARQIWRYTTTINPIYTPLYVDLVDDYNQRDSYNNSSLYPDDQIKNVPYFILNRLATECKSWAEFKTMLAGYCGVPSAGAPFTQTQYDDFIEAWDNYFN